MSKNVLSCLQDLLETNYLWTHPDLPFSANLAPGVPNVLLVAGDNCSGKSLLAETLRAWVSRDKLPTISVSIRERTGSGLSDFAGMRRAMMFGNECESSTGAISARTVDTAFSTLQSRADEGHSALLVLDEPELGLSEGYAGALGEHIGQLSLQMSPLACGLVLVSHSKALAQRLAEALGGAPSFLHMGTPLSFEQWLQAPASRTVAELLALPVANREGLRAVSKILSEAEG